MVVDEKKACTLPDPDREEECDLCGNLMHRMLRSDCVLQCPVCGYTRDCSDA